MTEALRSMDAGMAAAEAELKLASAVLPTMGPPWAGLLRVLSATPAAARRPAATAAQELDAHSCGAAQICNGSGATQPHAQQQPAAVDTSGSSSAGGSTSDAAADPPVHQQPAAADGSGGAGGGGGSSAAAAQAPMQQQQQAAVGTVPPEDAPTQPQQQAGTGMQLELTPEAQWGATEGHFAEMLQDFLVRSVGPWPIHEQQRDRPCNPVDS